MQEEGRLDSRPPFAALRVELLSAEEERELGRRAEAGDEEARKELVVRNLPFVLHVAQQRYRGSPFMDDLIAAGAAALVRCARSWRHDGGARLTSYAGPSIRAAMAREFARLASPVKMPVSAHASATRIERERARLWRDLQREPTTLELAGALGLNVEELQALDAARAPAARLDRPLDGQRGKTVGDLLPDPLDVEEVVLTAIDSERRKKGRRVLRPLPRAEEDRLLDEIDAERERERVKRRVRRALAKLNPVDAQVVSLRHDLNGSGAGTLNLTEIGKLLGFSRERARQRYNRGLRDLENALRDDAASVSALRNGGKEEKATTRRHNVYDLQPRGGSEA